MKVNQVFLWDGYMSQLSTRVKFKTVKQAMGQHRHNDQSKVSSYCTPDRIGIDIEKHILKYQGDFKGSGDTPKSS